MAKYLKIPPDMLSLPSALALGTPPVHAMTLWVHLMTRNRETVVAGLHRVGPATLGDELGWSAEDARWALGALVDAGAVFYTQRPPTVFVPDALKADRPAGASQCASWIKSLDHFTPCPAIFAARRAIAEKMRPDDEGFRAEILSGVDPDAHPVPDTPSPPPPPSVRHPVHPPPTPPVEPPPREGSRDQGAEIREQGTGNREQGNPPYPPPGGSDPDPDPEEEDEEAEQSQQVLVPPLSEPDPVMLVWTAYREHRPRAKPTPGKRARRLIKSRLKEHSAADLVDACRWIQVGVDDYATFLREKGHDDYETLFKADKMERRIRLGRELREAEEPTAPPPPRDLTRPAFGCCFMASEHPPDTLTGWRPITPDDYEDLVAGMAEAGHDVRAEWVVEEGEGVTITQADLLDVCDQGLFREVLLRSHDKRREMSRRRQEREAAEYAEQVRIRTEEMVAEEKAKAAQIRAIVTSHYLDDLLAGKFAIGSQLLWHSHEITDEQVLEEYGKTADDCAPPGMNIAEARALVVEQHGPTRFPDSEAA